MMNISRKQDAGVASIEFALILALGLAPLFWAAIEAGRMFYQYDVVVKNVRIAARYLSVYSQAETSGTSLETTAKNMVRCGTLTQNGCGSPVVSGLSSATISVSYTTNQIVSYSGGSSAVSYVTVNVTGFKLNYLSGVFSQSLVTFSPISASFRQASI